ncbi:alanine dehydrogenase [bacterium]|nr:alanine dehydrogenase [bacterium]
MIIGIPRERKTDERRVALTPDGALELTRMGHSVIIEQGAGVLSGFTDAAYTDSNTEVVPSLEEVWSRCDLLVKVKEPAPEEVQYFRRGLSVFSFLHLAVAPELTRSMVESGVTGLDYDLVMLDNGRLPILEPMSVIAGQLSIQCGAYALQAGTGGRGILLGGAIGVRPGRVVVIGAGAAGSNAARVALGMGAEVTIIDINEAKLTPFFDSPRKVRTIYSTPLSVEREIKEADIVVGAVLLPGALAPKLITRQMISSMQKGAAIVDICIDQGGIAETSKPTTITHPTYIENGVVHYCVTNMPALVPRTSTIALTNATLPWIKMIAEKGVQGALSTSKPLRRGLTSYQGKLTNGPIAEAVGMKFTPAEEIAL